MLEEGYFDEKRTVIERLIWSYLKFQIIPGPAFISPFPSAPVFFPCCPRPAPSGPPAALPKLCYEGLEAVGRNSTNNHHQDGTSRAPRFILSMQQRMKEEGLIRFVMVTENGSAQCVSKIKSNCIHSSLDSTRAGVNPQTLLTLCEREIWGWHCHHDRMRSVRRPIRTRTRQSLTTLGGLARCTVENKRRNDDAPTTSV